MEGEGSVGYPTLDIRMVLSLHVGPGNQTWQVHLLMAWPFLQPLISIILKEEVISE